MGVRALEFSRANPDPSPGYEAAVTRLAEGLNRADLLTDQQRNGIIEVRIASERKRDLRRSLRTGHLSHLRRVAQAAGKEAPGLYQRFKRSVTGSTYLSFRAAARGMVAEAAGRKDLLIAHGLSSTVLDALSMGLDQFDEAVKQGTEGRRAHIGASAELDGVADDIAQIVRVMDALNRVRFATDSERLAAWIAASTIQATPVRVPVEPETPGAPTVPEVPAGAEVKPAA